MRVQLARTLRFQKGCHDIDCRPRHDGGEVGGAAPRFASARVCCREWSQPSSRYSSPVRQIATNVETTERLTVSQAFE